jgi:hypothetical protein
MFTLMIFVFLYDIQCHRQLTHSVLLVKLIVANLVKKISAYYKTGISYSGARGSVVG